MAQQPEMCVIGYGRMGRRAVETFDDGFRIRVVSGRDLTDELRAFRAEQALEADAVLREADIVVLAVPVERLRAWVPSINATAKGTCVVLECCTAREATARALTELERRSFGLPELGAKTQPVVGTPDPRIAAYLVARDVSLEPISVEEYDRQVCTGTVQFLGMALQTYLDDEARARLARSPAGTYITNLIRHLETNSPSTYYETQVLNAHMSEARKRLIAHLVSVDWELDAGRLPFEAASRSEWRP